MIIYCNTKSGFHEDVFGGCIDTILEKNLRDIARINAGAKEKRSWNQSLQNMDMVLSCSSLPDNVTVSIEYNIPFTSKRVDFIISGYDRNRRNSAVIVELKGWESAEITEFDGLVHTAYYPNNVLHPCYQAWSYANYITNFNSEVIDGNVLVTPCSFLYNYPRDSVRESLSNEFYEEYLLKAEIFYKEDRKAFVRFIEEKISESDFEDTIRKIERGRPAVSASLQKSMAKVLTNKDFFAPIDKQKEIYSEVIAGLRDAYAKGRKTVYIVKGGPGTGKSVLAMKMMAELNGGYRDSVKTKEQLAFYVTKTSAPRKIYGECLMELAKDVRVRFQFKGASNFVGAESNSVPTIIVDEAHRLTTRSSQYVAGGKNQVMEIINAAVGSVFFIDEDQTVSLNDLGTVDEIKKWAHHFGAHVVEGRRLELITQFRCNGCDGYISWVDDVLGVRGSPDIDVFGIGGYDITVADTPQELTDAIKSRRAEGFRARTIAGYCWSWNSRGDTDGVKTDIDLGQGSESMKWNLDTDSWAGDAKQEDLIGCIHSSQGLEFDYIGVIIGDDMSYEDGRVSTHPERNQDRGTLGRKQSMPEKADRVIRNTYRTLMTRGMKGCVVYATDQGLREYLKKRVHSVNQQLGPVV